MGVLEVRNGGNGEHGGKKGGIMVALGVQNVGSEWTWFHWEDIVALEGHDGNVVIWLYWGDMR